MRSWHIGTIIDPLDDSSGDLAPSVGTIGSIRIGKSAVSLFRQKSTPHGRNESFPDIKAKKAKRNANLSMDDDRHRLDLRDIGSHC